MGVGCAVIAEEYKLTYTRQLRKVGTPARWTPPKVLYTCRPLINVFTYTTLGCSQHRLG